MFNNPLDSFHDTVAEAKEEREQLDRLLTISTARERLLVGGVALLLFILAVWLVLGNVPPETRQQLDDGRPGVDIAVEQLRSFLNDGVRGVSLAPPILRGGARDYEAARQTLAAVR